jgi:hypothetical protein
MIAAPPRPRQGPRPAESDTRSRVRDSGCALLKRLWAVPGPFEAEGGRAPLSPQRRSRSEFVSTLTDDRAMATAAYIGSSRRPKAG